MTGGYVKEAQLVRPRRVIEARLLHRIARISEIAEIDAFHHAPIGDVQAGNDSGANCHISTPTNYTGTGAYRRAIRLGVSPSICHLSKPHAHSGQTYRSHPAPTARAAFNSRRPTASSRPLQTPHHP